MEVNEIDKILKNIDSELQTTEQKSMFISLMKQYEGDDEITSSDEYVEAMNRLRGNKEIMKLYSRLPTMDKITEGFWEGNVVVISGPTKEGKTTLFQTLTMNFTDEGHKCLWFPFDTPGEELIQRFKHETKIYLPKKNPSAKKLDWIEKKIIEGLAKYGTRVVFIDHLGMLTRASDNERNYSTELSSIMMELKQIAIRWRVVIFLNHHIKKIQADTVPMYSDLKDSSGVAQDSDMVIMVWRKKEKRNGVIYHLDKAALGIQTNRRTGKTGVVHVVHKGDHFEEEILETRKVEVESTDDI